MAIEINLNELYFRESERVEWKENVADIDDVVRTLAAFANDINNLGGGYVVCGAREARDANGFPRIEPLGLDAERLREVRDGVLEGCRARVRPSIVPIFFELPGESESRRVLVIAVSRTPHVHTFVGRDKKLVTPIRVDSRTLEARNGQGLHLLAAKGQVEPWDRRPCLTASATDVDLVALRDTLVELRLADEQDDISELLSDTRNLHHLLPPLLHRDPLTGRTHPRNFVILLFGKAPQRLVPGAYVVWAEFPGTTVAEGRPTSEQILGSLITQVRRLTQLLQSRCTLEASLDEPTQANAWSFPATALIESMVNVIGHRDYEVWGYQPSRFSVFADRVEMFSPGGLMPGMRPADLSGLSRKSMWRNQCIGWFFEALRFAQGLGQGLGRARAAMAANGNPEPTISIDDASVTFTLPAHPRHTMRALERLGFEEEALGRHAAAAALFSEALELAQKHLSPTNTHIPILRAHAARALAAEQARRAP